MGMLDSLVGSAANFIFGSQAADKAHDQDVALSNSSYQRAVKDMKLAGLNPMLAYSKGGASTPSSPVAKTPDVSSDLSAGSSRALLSQQTRSARAQADIDEYYAGIIKKTGVDPRNPVATSVLGAVSGQNPILNSGKQAAESIKPDWWDKPIWQMIEQKFARDSGETPNSAKTDDTFQRALKDLPMMKPARRLNDDQLRKKYGWIRGFTKK